MELNQPIDQIARARGYSRKPRSPYQQHRRRSSLLQSLTSLVPGWQSSSVSLAPQLPPLQLEDWDVVWYTGPWISVAPSPLQSARNSVRSRPSLSRVSSAPTQSVQRRGSARSGTRPSTGIPHTRASISMYQTQVPSTPSTHSSHAEASTSTHPTQHASTLPTTATGPSAPSMQRSTTPRPRRPGTQSSSASEPLSPLDAALTTRTSGNVWKPGSEPRVMAKATMEGFIHYLLLTSAGDKSRLLLESTG